MIADWQNYLMQQRLKISSDDLTVPFVCDLSDFGYLKIEGAKALPFLQGQLTCDVLALQNGEAIRGAYLNLQGRIIATVRVFRSDDHIYLQCARNILSELKNKLSKIAMLSRVTLTDVSDEFTTIGLVAEALADTQPFCIIQADTAHKMCVGKTADVIAFCDRFVKEYAITDVWNYHQIEQGLVEINKTVSERYTPHDINLPAQNAVSFTKGCYVGQEIVARMQYRGKLKQHLYKVDFHISEKLAPRDEVFDSKTKNVAYIVNIVSLPDATQRALVVAKDEMFDQALFTKDNIDLKAVWYGI